jgi:hypothetical protein
MRFDLFKKRLVETLQAVGYFPGQTHEDAMNELGELAMKVEEMYKSGHSVKEVAELLETYLQE